MKNQRKVEKIMSDTKDLVDTITTGNNVEAERIFQDNMVNASWR